MTRDEEVREATPRCDKLLRSIDGNDLRAWGSLARQLERELRAERERKDGMVLVPKSALDPVIKEWDKSAARYERAGSDHHLTMPGHWPFEVTLSMDGVRAIVAAIRAQEPDAAATTRRDG